MDAISATSLRIIRKMGPIFYGPETSSDYLWKMREDVEKATKKGTDNLSDKIASTNDSTGNKLNFIS